MSPLDREGEALRRLVMQSIEPGSWHDDRRNFASGVINHWSGRLIVVNRPSIEKRVGEFLEKLRASRANGPEKSLR